jgi:hypothetical protein
LQKCHIDNENLNEWSDEQLCRLSGVMEGDQAIVCADEDLGVRIDKVSFHDTFQHFLMKHDLWNKRGDGRVFLIWDNPQLQNKMVIRRQQNSGLCYMHAPVVLQHYLLSINNIRSEIELIDIPRYLASQKELLYKYLKFALSGSSENFLREIYAGDPSFKTNTYTLNPSDYHEILKHFLWRLQHQPALVSRFQVDQNFQNSQKTSFLDPTDFNGSSIGSHSMVLIGYRLVTGKDGDEVIFLLQNWWEDRYFIEVSASYFAECGGSITLVTSCSDCIPRSFPKTDAEYAETSTDSREQIFEKISLR